MVYICAYVGTTDPSPSARPRRAPGGHRSAAQRQQSPRRRALPRLRTSTITRTAARDPAFAAQLVQAEQSAEIHLLRSVQAAAKEMKYWRAAAWLLERRNPEDFGLRPPQLFTSRQVVELFARVAEILRGDLPEENCRPRDSETRRLDRGIRHCRPALASLRPGRRHRGRPRGTSARGRRSRPR